MAQINITLPDGTIKNYPSNVTGSQIATDIGPGLAKAAIAMEVNGTERDLSEQIQEDSALKFLTVKDARGLDAARHTLTAQVLARAVKAMFPKAKLAIGPTVEHGFYYDVDFSEEATPLSSDDLPKLEQKMRDLMGEKNPVAREVLPAAEVRQIFADAGETYKLEIIDGAIEKGELINGTDLSIWRQTTRDGTDFVDLCRGPHATNLGQLPKAFTLTNLAGAYWRGDSNNQQLTRIYGLAFATKDELTAHQHMLAEAKKRDHRKLGESLNLFHFSDRAPGQVFWHNKGWTVYLELMDYMRRKVRQHQYTEVSSPQLMDLEFWQWSGHWDKYRENMFVAKEADGSIYALKPMSCPGGVQIFNHGTVSYRDLPMRMAEFGSVFRREASGARHGLMRVQAFTQDDAHIFCTPEQLEDEVVAMCDLIAEVYKELGFSSVQVKFSTRPDERIGSEEDWDKAEAVLQKVCNRLSLPWKLNEGDGAFYAPKLDFVLTDAIGREWQCGTVQVDMNLPTRLKMEYDSNDGTKQRPHMVHRAILGSVERFMGVMIEDIEGRFPTWLAPTQITVVPIAERHNDYAHKLQTELANANIITATGGLRVEVDDSSERMQKKILLAQQQKTPYMLVVGDKEAEEGTAAVRLRNGKDLGAMKIEDIITRLKTEIETRTDNPENAHVNKEAEAA